MIIDTKKRVIAIQLRRLITLVIIIVAVMAIMLIGKLPNTFLGLNKYHWAIVVGILYAISVVVDALLKYTYIYYNDETDKIILRYFSLSQFNRKKHSVEIPKAEYSSFLLKESLFGYKKKLILRRYYKNVEAKYAPIPLTILTKEQFALLLISLDRNSKK